MTNLVATTYSSLLANAESTLMIDGEEWGCVYLDNARLDGQSAAQFRAHLAALAKQGLYKVIDGECFGAVKLVSE